MGVTTIFRSCRKSRGPDGFSETRRRSQRRGALDPARRVTLVIFVYNVDPRSVRFQERIVV